MPCCNLFNTEVFEDACLYYEPSNAKSAANKIIKAVTDDKIRDQLIEKMAIQLKKFSSFETYFNATVDFLEEVGNGKLDYSL